MKKKQRKLSDDEYIAALERMKNSPKDRVGLLADLGAVGIGGAAGAGAAVGLAGAAGVATLFGSSTLATVLGGVFVTSTPVGWVVGSVAAGAAIGYGVTRFVRSGGKSDAKTEHNIRELEKIVHDIRMEALQTADQEGKLGKIIDSLQLLVINHKITQEESTDLVAGVESGNITIKDAFNAIEEMLHKE